MNTNKLEALRVKLLAQTLEKLNKDGITIYTAENYTARLVEGKKYTKLDIGPTCNMSGKYMIDNETGDIFGIKAYGVIHKGWRFGTLDTIDQYNWGGYRAYKLPPTAPKTEEAPKINRVFLALED